MTSDQFEGLLRWLNTDRTNAGLIYENTRRRLIHFFAGRGRKAPEDCADITLDRVASKLPENYSGDTFNYCYRFAVYIDMERQRKDRLETVEQDSPQPIRDTAGAEEKERKLACLERCAKTLSETDRRLVMGYYPAEGVNKMELRRGMAEQLKLSANALRIKASRIRAILRDCMDGCLAGAV